MSWLGRALVTVLAALACGTAVLLASCASPDELPAQRALAASPRDGAVAGAPSPSAASALPWPQAQWWRELGDAQLDALVEQALAGQPGLQEVLARWRHAQALTRSAVAAQRPQVTAAADAQLQRFSEHGTVSSALGGDTRLSLNAQIQGSWEWDLFGRQQAALAAALGQQRAAQAELRAAQGLLAAQVASGYFQLARLVAQQGLAAQAQGQRERALLLVRQRVAAGLDSAVDLHQAELLVAQSRLELSAWDDPLARARHALAELAGLQPGAPIGLMPRLGAALLAEAPAASAESGAPWVGPPNVRWPVQTAAETPVRSATPSGPRSVGLPAALPADLLGRRADLVALRWRVEAALRDVDGARAQFYPNINLMALVGLASMGLDHWLDLGSRTWAIGPALRLPLFDGGRLQATLGARSAQADAAIEAYNGALLRALREVADELAGLQALRHEAAAQAAVARAAEAGLATARARHAAGLGSLLPVLQAQTAVLTQQRAQVDLQTRHRLSEVALVRALGGGYQSEAALPHGPVANP